MPTITALFVSGIFFISVKAQPVGRFEYRSHWYSIILDVDEKANLNATYDCGGQNASSHGEVFLRQREDSNEFDLSFSRALSDDIPRWNHQFRLACARSTLVDGDLATFTFPTEDTLTSIVEGETVTFKRTTFRSNEKRYSYASPSLNISFRLLDDEFGALEMTCSGHYPDPFFGALFFVDRIVDDEPNIFYRIQEVDLVHLDEAKAQAKQTCSTLLEPNDLVELAFVSPNSISTQIL
ncbi:hypothetical protein FOZ62_007277, partial [Perkinsus olseni]